jgi:hypothetical protein
MGNLGAYQRMTTVAKKFGGPGRLLGVTLVTGAAVYRSSEAGIKKVALTIKNRNVPGATKGQVFRATSDGDGGGGLKIRVDDEYRVLECDGDPILIEVLGDPGNPYCVSSEFLRSVSDFSQDDADRSE